MTLWGGRFGESLDSGAWALNASIQFDRRLADQDVRGSLAWASALNKAGVLSDDEGKAIRNGLLAIQAEFADGSFAYQESDEDIHTAIERRLLEIVGPPGSKLHTGRSRNDQVATASRLWLLDHLPKLDAGLVGLQSVLVLRAEGDFDVVVNGYTHLQRAQPILLSHWWLSYFWPFQRDRERLVDLRARTARSPLGAAALAGTPFPIDRDALARELGFEGPSENSIDAVSDRDFIAEFLFCCALTGIHLSKLAEAVILFSSAEFGYLELPDAFTTGSSLMPQKKNPDIFELARGKSGTLIGHLTGLMAMLKGLPSAYDKDLQEDKQPMFAAYDTLSSLLPVVSDALRALEMHPERMLAAIDPATMATDLADELVRTGIPFRQAHSLVGEAVRYAETQGKSLDQLKSGELRAISPALDLDLASILDPWRSIRQRNCIGGSAPEAVKAQIRQARDALPDHAPIQME